MNKLFNETLNKNNYGLLLVVFIGAVASFLTLKPEQ